MPSQAEIQKQITDRIIEGLKKGVVPWKKPWRRDQNAGAPANVISRRSYSGINTILLDLVAMSRGYASRYWGTYQQWADLGAQVRKRPDDVKAGQWGTQVVFYRQLKKTKVENGEEKIESFPLLRTYTVFNIDQVDGESVDHLRASQEAPPLRDDADYRAAREAIELTGADIRYGGDRAFYFVPEDYIQLPPAIVFDSLPDFYGAAFHELTHWSESRLGWKGSYAMGELIAEISACYIAAELGIPGSDDVTNHVAYLDSWLKSLERDPKAIFKAASQASKAANFILGFSRVEEPQSIDMQEVE